MSRALLAMAIATLCGCVGLPPCEKPEALILDSPYGPLVVLTPKQLVGLQHRMESIRDGKCDPDKEPEAI